ncbi:MAG TPA: hypothetical protein VKV28_04440 [Candidatus Binataceae bacterium]|nr:hypothetical protein [Candidatus Binataceae bacterium]
MTDPRIAAFARVASGNLNAARAIEGQRTKLTRVAHGIAYDPIHDLIIAAEPLAGSLVFFRGGANGNIPPLRVIQGPHTGIHQPLQVTVDPVHNEVWIADFGGARLAAYPLFGNGDVAPLRVISSARTGMRLPAGVAVDPQTNLVIAAARDAHYHGGLYIFKRTDNGDVAPLRVISGPTTGLLGVWHVQAWHGIIYATALNSAYRMPYDPGGHAPMPGCKGPISEFAPGPLGFIGIWKETDNGDVAPRGIIRGADTQIIEPGGLALDPRDGEIFVSSGRINGITGYLTPQFFAPSLSTPD